MVELDATPDAVVQAVCILQQRAEEAVTTIAEVEDQSVLILVNACDSRKSVKAAAKERGVFLEDEAAKAVQEAPERLRGGELIGTAHIHLRREQNRRTRP